jgi:hypothetical protein
MPRGRKPERIRCRGCSRILTVNHPKVSEGAYWYCADCWYHREKERERAHRHVLREPSAD